MSVVLGLPEDFLYATVTDPAFTACSSTSSSLQHLQGHATSSTTPGFLLFSHKSAAVERAGREQNDHLAAHRKSTRPTKYLSLVPMDQQSPQVQRPTMRAGSHNIISIGRRPRESRVEDPRDRKAEVNPSDSACEDG